MKKPFSRGQGLFGSEPVIMLAPKHGLATIGGHICHAVHFGHKYRYGASSEDEAPPEHFQSCKQYEKNRKGKEVAIRSPSPSHNPSHPTFTPPDLPIRLDFSDDEDDDLLQAIEASRIAYATDPSNVTRSAGQSSTTAAEATLQEASSQTATFETNVGTAILARILPLLIAHFRPVAGKDLNLWIIATPLCIIVIISDVAPAQ
ncbi:hypothetical protein EYR40_009821 [Pleurotus pulmonarius]|nr:hypothetical protein EYR40_009821 [Pleurotus pulmonarius]